MDYEGGDH